MCKFLLQLIRMTYMSRNEPGERLDQSVDDNTPEFMEMFQKEEFKSTNSMAASNAQLANGETKEPESVEEGRPLFIIYHVHIQ